MKTAIIYFSVHHDNTEKVATAMAKPLNADLKKTDQTDPNALSDYDLVGFGSGIFYGKHNKSLLELADKLPLTKKKAFIFSTSGTTNEKSTEKFHKSLKTILIAKGFDIVGEFNCAGFDTFGPLKLIGGIKKGRPNQEDLKNAEDFAYNLKTKASIDYPKITFTSILACNNNQPTRIRTIFLPFVVPTKTRNLKTSLSEHRLQW